MYTYTNADNGRTVVVRVNDMVIVNLSTCPETLWTEPDTSDPVTLTRMGGNVDVSAGTATARFVAVTTGQAQITAFIQRTGVCAPPGAFFDLYVVVQ